MNRELVFTTFVNIDNLEEFIRKNLACYDVINCDIEGTINLPQDYASSTFTIITASDTVHNEEGEGIKYSLEGLVVFDELLGFLWIHYAQFSSSLILYQLVKLAVALCPDEKISIGYNALFFSSEITHTLEEIGYSVVCDKDDVYDLFGEPNSTDDDYVVISPGLTPSFNVTLNFYYSDVKLVRGAVIYTRKSLNRGESRQGERRGKWGSNSFARPGFRKAVNMKSITAEKRRDFRRHGPRRGFDGRYGESEVSPLAITTSLILAMGLLAYFAFNRGAFK